MKYGPDDIVFKPNPGAWYVFFIVSPIIFVFCIYYVFATGGVRVEDADYNAAVITAMLLGIFTLILGPFVAVACHVTRYILTGTHLIVTELVGGFPVKETQEIAYDSITRVEEGRPGFWYIWFIASPLSLKQIIITYTKAQKGTEPRSLAAFVVPKDRKRFLEMLGPRLRSKNIIIRNDTKR